MKSLVQRHIQSSIDAKIRLMNQCSDSIEAAGRLMVDALRAASGKILLCGNGGSAADAQHIAAELVIRYRSGNDRPSLPALSLAADSSALTAGANDFGFDEVFARQVMGLGQRGDVFIGITTSGNSENVRRALLVAHEKGMRTIVLTGGTGGRIVQDHAAIVDAIVQVPATETARVQEAHILVGHILCAIVEQELFGLDSGLSDASGDAIS